MPPNEESEVERNRVIDREKHQVTSFASIEAFLHSDTRMEGILTINDGYMPIDVLVSRAQSDTTICFFHGAIENHFTLPILSGLGISDGVDSNRVFVSDPSLVIDDQLFLAWYAGNFYQDDLQDKISAILAKVTESLGSKRLIFFGGSGGGFAALYFASRFPNSYAIVFNPQTDISRYKRMAVRDFAEKSFLLEATGNDPIDGLPQHIVTDLCEHYAKKQSVTIGYLQNTNDFNHVNNHLLPFLQSLHPENEAYLLAERWKDGHTPPPKKLLKKVLNTVAERHENPSGLKELGFERVHDQGAQVFETLRR